jgi:hypothetical protein
MVLSKPRLIAQERLDKEDWDVLLQSAEVDSKFWTKNFVNSTALIVQGFEVSGLGGTGSVSVSLTNSTLINPENSDTFSWYSAPVGASPLSATLTPDTRNYIELELSKVNSTPLTRAMWDKSANNGAGGEFQQIIDTVTDIEISAVVLTGGFSGNPNRIPIAIVDTDGSNIVKIILDERQLLWRLGTPSNPSNNFSWSSQTESTTTLALTGGSGTFIKGETVTFTGGATATVVVGGTTSIQVVSFSDKDLEAGDTVTGSVSGAARVLNTASQSFTAADKSIKNFKDMFEAICTEIKAIKGTDFWFETYAPNQEQRVAGENLSVGDWIYISDGTTGVDSGRTAGRVYKAEAGSTNGSVRGQTVGIVVEAGNTGEFVKYKTSGKITLSSLTEGKIYYVSPSTPGAIIGTRPTGANQYATPVGFSISSTELMIAIQESTIVIELQSLAVIEVDDSDSPIELNDTMNRRVFMVDTSSGPVVFEFPNTPLEVGTQFEIIDKMGTFDLNPVTLDVETETSGSEINNSATNVLLKDSMDRYTILSDGTDYSLASSGKSKIIKKNKNIIRTDLKIEADENGSSVGPIEIADGVTVEVDGTWVII